jgi:peptidoglycan L-alanyl-D-glutamate endopeptidase CwlK
MPNFKLSGRSLLRLNGVKDELRDVVTRAIELTKVDFGVIEGLRTEKRQKELLASGASQTMKSKHLTGDAVDLMAYIGSRGSWELNLYDDIADAMKEAAIEKNIGIRWGAAWNVNDLRNWGDTMDEAMNYYIDTRRNEGRRPFIDAPHFELI